MKELLQVKERTKLSEGILLAVDCKGSEVVTSDTLGNVYYSVDNKQVILLGPWPLARAP